MLLIACAMAALPQPVRVYPAANVVEFWQKCGFYKVVTVSSKLRDDVFEWRADAALTIESVLLKVAKKVPQTGADAIFQVQPPAPSLQPTATHSQLLVLRALVIAARSGPGPKDSPENLLILGLGYDTTNLLVSALNEPSSLLELGVWHDSSLSDREMPATFMHPSTICGRVRTIGVSERGAFLIKLHCHQRSCESKSSQSGAQKDFSERCVCAPNLQRRIIHTYSLLLPGHTQKLLYPH
jgi:hypothetical protein